MSWLAHLAAKAPVPVFPVIGVGVAGVLHELALAERVVRVDSPRHASVLLVVGEVPARHREALQRIHDQLPRPFATLWLCCEPLPGLASARRLDDPAALVEALVALHGELMTRRRGSSPRLLADEPPNPWRGLGDDGHGGEGMMGGTPYGRPMAMNMHDDIRDGLTLDSLTFRLGPFYPLLPAGLAAEVTLQGDVIQSWAMQSNAYPQAVDRFFHSARRQPVPIAELELARARHHLYRLFHALRLAGLERIGLIALRQAATLTPQSSLGGLRQRLIRCGFFRLAALDGGVLAPAVAEHLGGPAARAVGIDCDQRSEDGNYRRLGFAPVCHTLGDTRTRWRQVLAEIEQSLQLACRAAREDLYTDITGDIEGPRGACEGRGLEDTSDLLDGMLPGLEWDAALAAIASLDLAGVTEQPLGESCVDVPLGSPHQGEAREEARARRT